MPSKVKGKHQENVCRIEDTALTFLISISDDSEQSASYPAQFTLGTVPPVPIRYENVWVQKSVWMLWRQEKFLAFAGNQIQLPSQ